MSSIKSGKQVIQFAFLTVGISLALIAINAFITGGAFWARYPIFFLIVALVIQLFIHLGKKASEKFEDRQEKKRLHEEEELELRQFEEMHRTKNRNWEDKDMV